MFTNTMTDAFEAGIFYFAVLTTYFFVTSEAFIFIFSMLVFFMNTFWAIFTIFTLIFEVKMLTYFANITSGARTWFKLMIA